MLIFLTLFKLQDQFYEYMFAEAVKHETKVLLENKPKFLLVCNHAAQYIRIYF